MSNDFNQVLLVGRCGSAPEVFRVDDKPPFAKVQIATNKQWKKDSTLHKRTNWHTVVFNRKLAEVVENHLGKGDKIFIKGELQTQKWQDKDGNARSSVFVQAQELRFLTPKPKQETNAVSEPTPEPELVDTDDEGDEGFDDIPF